VIRVEEAGDWPAIVEVHRQAFGEEDVAGLVERLRAGGYDVPSLSFVAVSDGRVVGNVMHSWSSVDADERGALQLSPLGVLPAYQSRGFGSQLVRAALAGIRAFGEPLVLLEGNPRYYGRFGFVRADELGLLPPPGTPPWGFQVAVLDESAQLPRGRVTYALPYRERGA
jgi:putative acetyltransferase